MFISNTDEKAFGKFVVLTLRQIDHYFTIEENVVGSNRNAMTELEQR